MSSLTHRSRIIVSATLVALVVVIAIPTTFLHLLQANAGGLVLFGQVLENEDGWFSFSYGATDSLTNTAPVHSGQDSIVLTVTGAYGAVVFGRWKPPVDATTYTGISFWINGGTTDGTRSLHVSTTPNSDGSGTQSTVVNVDAPANTWTHIVIPMSALGNPATIGQITIGDRLGQAQPTLYLDDITLSNS